MNQIVFISFVLGLIYFGDLITGKNEEFLEFLSIRHTTILKGIAIFTVVWGHVTAKLGVSHIQMVAEIGVWLFLFCSGYGCWLSMKKNGIKGFWRKRIIKVFMPFWVCELIGLILTRKFCFESFILDMSFVKPATAYGWFMGFIMVYYIAFWILGFLKKRTNVSDNGILNIMIGFSIVVFIYYSTADVNPLFPALKARQSFAFTLGMIVAKEKNRMMESFLYVKDGTIVRKGLMCFGLLFMGGGMKVLTKILEPRVPYLLSNITALVAVTISSIAVILLTVFFDGLFSKKYFYVMGEISFAIYMVHAFTLEILDGKIGGSLAFMIITFALSIIVNLIVTKVSWIVDNLERTY